MDREAPRHEKPENSPAKPEIEIADEPLHNRSSTTEEFCLNCGTRLLDTYCHHCGQKNIPRRRTIGDTLMNFVSSNWSFEGKFFLTTKYILTTPGFLAVEYNAGRRESYYHPARMYVFISFVFFLLYFSLPSTKSTGPVDVDLNDYGMVRKNLRTTGLDTVMHLERAPDSVLKRMMPVIMDSLSKRQALGPGKNTVAFSLTDMGYRSVGDYDSVQRALPEDERDGFIARYVIRRAVAVSAKYSGRMDKFSADMSKGVSDNFSKILFWLLPAFALLLKLLYIRRDFYYSEHLVFSVYYYDFFFLAGSIYMLAAQINDSWLTFIIGTWMYLYLLFAMKRAYGQGWIKTILKFGIFSALFFVLFLIAFLITMFAIIMSM